ncbi:MAG: class I SAM-dependent methyltransferase [Burkholderiales bacterium]|nr:class I SAM-dependent methyltransferase [Burkholderiales bacterium]
MENTDSLTSSTATSIVTCDVSTPATACWDAQQIIQKLPTFYVSSAGMPEALAALTLQTAEQSFPFLAQLSQYFGHAPLHASPIESFAHDASAHAASEQLAALFNQYGSDKASVHNYHLLYGAILNAPAHIRAVLEIGMGTNNEDVVSTMGRGGHPGASLRAFRDFLPNARIYGADIDERILFNESRIETFFVDQTDLAITKQLFENLHQTFDLIIDDGLHAPNANISVLLAGLDYLNTGGCLVVEDIASSHLPVWQVIASLIPAERYAHFLVQSKAAYLFVIQRK